MFHFAFKNCWNSGNKANLVRWLDVPVFFWILDKGHTVSLILIDTNDQEDLIENVKES